MSNLIELSLKTPHNGFYNITREVTEAIKESGLDSGIALVFCPHTTAAVTLTENTDPLVGEDLLREMEDAFPHHDDFKHIEGNSHAYMRSCNMGVYLPVIIDEGWPLLGIWQNIFFVEYDGPRERKYYVKLISC